MKKLMLLSLVICLNASAGTSELNGSRAGATSGAVTKSSTNPKSSPLGKIRISPSGKSADFGNGMCAYCMGTAPGCVWNPGSATGGCDSPCTYDKIPCNKLDF